MHKKLVFLRAILIFAFIYPKAACSEQKNADNTPLLNTNTPLTIDEKQNPSRIAHKLQKDFINKFAARELKDKNSRAWALFSYSGWSNQGHIWVFESGDKKYQVFFASPNTSIFNLQRASHGNDVWEEFLMTREACR